MRERGIVRSIGESIDPGRTFVAMLAAAGLSFALALLWMLIVYRGYGDGHVPENLGWGLAIVCWAGAVLVSYVIAGRVRGNAWIAAGVALVSWPPMILVAWWMVTVAACAGHGPYGCPFS